MSTKMKLASLISAFILVVGLVVIGVLAASSKTISMNGSVSFNVLDKSLWVKEVRMQETGSEAVEIADFTPGYINGDFNFTVGDFENNRGSFALYFDIINTTTNSYNVSVAVPESYTSNNIEVSVTSSIPANENEIATITSDTPVTTTLMLIVTNPNLTTIDLSDIVINIEEVPPTPASSFTFSYSGADHTASITAFTGSETEVIIPSTVENKGIIYKVTSIGDSAFYICDSLTSITIPSSVTSIGDSAFSECYNLTSVDFGENSKLISIGDSAFYNCTSLTSITIPEGVTSIGWNAFYSCSSLTSITIPEGVTSIGDSAFDSCGSLTSIIIPEGVTSIGWNAFYSCSSLTSITIPDTVTSIGEYAFGNCSSLTSITIPEGVTSIGSYTFFYCRSLTSITIPEGVTSIGDSAFYNCTSLTSITIPSSVTSIGERAFSDCNFSTVTIDSSYAYQNAGDGYRECGYLLQDANTVRVSEACVTELELDANSYLNSNFNCDGTPVDGYYVFTRNQ